MLTGFPSIEVLVLRDGKEIDRAVRPLHQTAFGPAVRYKRKLWLVQQNSINLSSVPVEDLQQTNDKQQDEPTDLITDANPDRGQESVVCAPSEERLLVDAGPGTGKTHVACQRIASMLRDGMPASRIWIVSFTRTAIHEIRNRLAATLENPADAASVKIATLDSYAWSIQSGFSGKTALSGSYDDNINNTLSKIRSDEEVHNYLSRTRHLIVDEAQDVVGPRAALVLAIINSLDAECGVTVFADKAQAIYGFTEDSKPSGGNIRLVDELKDRGFRTVVLSQIHRTKSPQLLSIFTDVRQEVLDGNVPVLIRDARVREEIKRLAHDNIGSAEDLKLNKQPSNALILMRQRFDVLLASSFNQNVPHRLRMSGLPVRILPWVGLLLWDHTSAKLLRSEFESRWNMRIKNGHGIPDKDYAWKLLFEAAGESETVIDLFRLRTVLGRANPPVPFTSPEFGDEGPILGTIHASKGREADEVCLYLPPGMEDEENGDAEEEVRVMFVGATRARSRLSVGSSLGSQSSRTEGRVWRYFSKGVQIEVGQADDINAEGLVGKAAFSTQKDALRAQETLIQNPVQTGIFASSEKIFDWNFGLKTRAGEQIGVLSRKVKDDLTEIANKTGTWPPPSYLAHVRSMGLRTMAIRPDDPRHQNLHEPWSSSGFLLAPMLTGLCQTKLGKKKA